MAYDHSPTAKSVDEEVWDFINDLYSRFFAEEIISALELQIYVLKEKVDE